MARTTKPNQKTKPAAARTPRAATGGKPKAAKAKPQPTRAGSKTTAAKAGAAGATARLTRREPPAPGDVQQRAFELYQARGAVPGRDVEDWLTAEAELAAKPRSR